MDAKDCIECKLIKPATEFYRHPTHRHGLSSRCKVCTLADQARRWRAKHPEPPPPDGLKNCPHCHTRKPKNEFYKNRSTHDGLQGICKKCQVSDVVARHKANKEKHSTYQNAWAKKNPDKRADIHLKVRLGLPHGTYDRMLAEQDGKCAICGTDKPADDPKFRRFCVDHDAETGAVRGLLCGRCNTGIGQLRHDRTVMLSAIKYLDRF